MKPWLHIVGGGLSGLSLGEALATYPRLPGPVVISEPHIEHLKHKTFSYWFEAPERGWLHPDFILPTWTLSHSTRTVTHQGSATRYGTSCGAEVLERALAMIESHPQIELRREVLQSAPEADRVIDTRPPKMADFKITQSFSGIEIETPTPHGMTDVGLMESMEPTPSGIRFCYRLPLGTHRVLIEHTEFTREPGSPDALDAANQDFIASRWGQTYRIIRREQAHIPMGFKACTDHWGIPFGTRAGMARDATGYGYKSIRRESIRAAFELLNRGQLSQYRPSAWMRWTDHLFLNLLTHRPDVMPDSLLHIARNMSADGFARFMMGESPGAVARVITSAPIKPFACALLGRYQWI